MLLEGGIGGKRQYANFTRILYLSDFFRGQDVANVGGNRGMRNKFGEFGKKHFRAALGKWEKRDFVNEGEKP